MHLRDLTLKKKQFLGVAVILVLMGSAGVYTVTRMSLLRAQLNQVTGEWFPTAVELAAIGRNTSLLRISQLQYVFESEDSMKTLLAARMTELIEAIEASQDALAPFVDTDAEERLYRQYDETWDRYVGLSNDFLIFSLEGRRDAAVGVLNGEAQVVFDELIASLLSFVDRVEEQSFASAEASRAAFRRTRMVAHTLVALTLLISLFFAVYFVRWITVPLKQLTAAADRIGGGDLNVHVTKHGDDEIGRLADSFNEMTGSLRDASTRIEMQQGELRAANEELAGKNRDLEEALEQLKATQQQLIMSEKMASLGNLVAGVAHEINNPVGAVKSAADTSARSIALLRKQLDLAASLEGLRDDKRFNTALNVLCENNDVTVTASGRITTIVQSLRNFARLDESEFQEADIHEGIDSTLTLLYHELKTHVAVVKDYGEVPPIQCYPNQLNQVFMNVLSNASHAIEDEGTITIRTRTDGESVVIEVIDTGRGMSAEVVGKIFDPGFTTKGVGVGTGLGLSISYNIVQKHRGRIEVESEEGKGTTMKIVVPIRQEGVPT